MGIEFVKDQRALRIASELAPFAQFFAFDHLTGGIARVAYEECAQAATHDLFLQCARGNFVVVFGVEENWDGAESFKNAQQFFVGRVVRNEMAHVDVAKGAGNTGQSEATAAGDTNVIASVFGRFVLAIDVVVEIGYGLAQVFVSCDRRILLVSRIDGDLFNPRRRVWQWAGFR